MYQSEDPAVVMARRLLHRAKKEYDQQEREDKIMARQMTTTCCECGKTVPKKGCKCKEEDGKRHFICPECSGQSCAEQHIERKAIVTTEQLKVQRRKCFFCNHEKFYLNLDSSVQCSECGSIFFKGASI